MEKRISSTEWVVFIAIVIWNIANLNNWFETGTTIISAIVLVLVVLYLVYRAL